MLKHLNTRYSERSTNINVIDPAGIAVAVDAAVFCVTPQESVFAIGSCLIGIAVPRNQAALCQHNGIVDRKLEFIVIVF